MKIYLVGGAVRDSLLHLPIKEKDYVVVGATPQDMLKQGFRQVGKDFPVFLHPKTGEEYALARVEKKIGRGYKGFSFDASPDVTLEEDLKRRDLTINAIAQDENGNLIDPYKGQTDLQNKLLKHVSESFVEDPVRILRVARFAARFAYLGFTVATDTIALMKKMVIDGEVDALVAERVWKEWERALGEKNPEKFFSVLEQCNALSVLFPEINAEGINALISTGSLTEDKVIRLAALLHTKQDVEIKSLCNRYKIPSEYQELALLVCHYLSTYQTIESLSEIEILALLQSTDAFRREERFNKFLLACEACSQKKTSSFWKACYDAAKTVNLKKITHDEPQLSGVLSGQLISNKIAECRQEAIKELLSSHKKTGEI